VKPARALALGVTGALAASAATLFALHGTGVLRDAVAFPAAGTVTILCTVTTGWLAKALKFRLLAARLGKMSSLRRSLAVAVGCDFAFVASPGGVAGYPATVLLFARIGVDAPRALAVAAADQLLDLAFFGIAMPLALVWLLVHGLPAVPVAAICAAAALALGAVLVLVTGFRRGSRIFSSLARYLSRSGWSKLRRLAELDRHWRQFRRHLRLLFTIPVKTAALIACATAAQWLARYATLGIALAWCGHRVPGSAVFLAQAVALHAGQWTGIPGGVGAADAILVESLRPWLPLAPLATALVVWRLATFHLTLLAGGAASAWLFLHNRGDSAACARGDDQPAISRPAIPAPGSDQRAQPQ
jgi:uncharacterized protein (TIRG00374 family)